MSFEQNVKDIKRIYYSLTGKEDPIVHITYRGTTGGIAEPWSVKIDHEEVKDKSYDVAAELMLMLLKDKLAKKVVDLEEEAAKYKRELNTFKD